MPMIVDIFNHNWFRGVELTPAMEDIPYQPTFLGQFGERLFPVFRSRTRLIAVQINGGQFTLIPLSAVGSPPVELELSGAKLRYFSTGRLAKGSTVLAEVLNGVINGPEAVALRTMAQELATRGTQIRTDFEFTNEHMRFGAIQGKVLDADGATVLWDWFAEYGIAEPSAIDFALDVATTNLRQKCDDVIQAVRTGGKGSWIDGVTQVHALCGATFYNLLVSHPMVERLYLGWAAARDLARQIADDFEFGGIVWHRYRGTDDGTTMAIPTAECRFFPVGANRAFFRAQGPGEFEPFIQEPGRDLYTITVPDRDRGAFTRLEMYSYPLYVCQRPGMLQKGQV